MPAPKRDTYNDYFNNLTEKVVYVVLGEVVGGAALAAYTENIGGILALLGGAAGICGAMIYRDVKNAKENKPS